MIKNPSDDSTVSEFAGSYMRGRSNSLSTAEPIGFLIIRNAFGSEDCSTELPEMARELEPVSGLIPASRWTSCSLPEANANPSRLERRVFRHGKLCQAVQSMETQRIIICGCCTEISFLRYTARRHHFSRTRSTSRDPNVLDS